MKENFTKSLQMLLVHEGGFVNDPKDPGGITNLGVTKAVYEKYVGHPVDEATMRGLTHEDVAPIYKMLYWDRIHGDNLPNGLDYAMFDCAVNSGVSRSVSFLQRILSLKADGVMGPETLEQVGKAKIDELIKQFDTERQRFLEGLDTFPHFGKGWTARISQVTTQALEMV